LRNEAAFGLAGLHYATQLRNEAAFDATQLRNEAAFGLAGLHCATQLRNTFEPHV
jgi:hypothetical protein